MYKNHKEYKTMIFLSLLLLSISFSLCAMDSEQAQPMQYDDSSLFAQLMKSAHKNKTKRVQELLGNQDIRAQCTVTRWGVDPLCWAAYHGNTAMATLLLQRGFELRVNPEDGSSPLHTAACHGRAAVLRLLVTFPHCLADNDLGRIKESAEESEVVRILTHRHFQFIRSLLDSKTTIVAVDMTPYEAACELPYVTCRDLIEPTGLYARLSAEVIANYETGLKETVQDNE